MKSDGVNRSNIFGITKDNHFNAVCVVLQCVAFRLSQSIDPPHLCSKCFLISFCRLCLGFEDLQTPVCFAAVEGGGRMYPISINLRAESDLHASVCAHA